MKKDVEMMANFFEWLRDEKGIKYGEIAERLNVDVAKKIYPITNRRLNKIPSSFKNKVRKTFTAEGDEYLISHPPGESVIMETLMGIYTTSSDINLDLSKHLVTAFEEINRLKKLNSKLLEEVRKLREEN